MGLLPFFSFPIQDLLSETDSMEPVTFKAFVRILWVMWQHDAKLPFNERQLSQVARVSLRTWRKIAPTILDRLMIIHCGSALTHERLWHEWHRARHSSELQRVRVMSRWRAPNPLKTNGVGHTAVLPPILREERKKERGHQGVVHISDALRATKVFKGH